MPAVRILFPLHSFSYRPYPVSLPIDDGSRFPFPLSVWTTTSTATATFTTTLTTTAYPIPPAPSEAARAPPKSHSNPGIHPFSPYITSNAATNETMLTAAIFSHPAVITWASLFCAFLVFAGTVFGLQKVMRRVRAKRWIKGQSHCRSVVDVAGSDTVYTGEGKDEDTKRCCTDEATNERTGKGEKGKKNRKVVCTETVVDARVYKGGTCEFINGSDLSLRADEGVDERSGCWSKRRDKRFRQDGTRDPEGRSIMN
ncbi:hypothetical protein TWF718_010860 [Orbilia javanica]|uniref:Uncharacterized protein n=1 Tax=Orbilia javanica TaxID=47235 RepID=A0AAN8MP55_9PEZI